MYKKYNFEPKNLSFTRRSPSEGGPPHIVDYKQILEGLTPFLVIATTFIWLWK